MTIAAIKEQIEAATIVEKETYAEAIARLSQLKRFEYDMVRDIEAERLGVRLATLDDDVKRLRPADDKQTERHIKLREVKLFPEPVKGDDLLTEIAQLIRRFIVCSEETANAAALWIAFTWFIDVVQVAPLAVITAPEKRCGKSLFLEVIGRLSHNSLVASNISPAAVFRVIEDCFPTLLIDEADAFFKQNEELRGIINSGHTRNSAFVVRTVGEDHAPKQFSTWGAKAISGIGTLSETIMDRSIRLRLKRKLKTDHVERLRHAGAGVFEVLESKLARFAEDSKQAIGDAKPELPEILNDRAQDNWDPLLAIADHAGGAWPKLAREAAIKLSAADQEVDSISSELLSDIRDVLASDRFGNRPRIPTLDLLAALIEDSMGQWRTCNRGQPLSAQQLVRNLKEYGLAPTVKRIGHATLRGYDRADFEDVFQRYISSPQGAGDEGVTAQRSKKY